MSALSVREVRSEKEREAVFAFRYAVYVEEMGRSEPYADHDAKRIVEPLDANCGLMAAFTEGGTIVGTVRINLSRDSDVSAYEGPYGMKAFAPFHPSATAIVTKLMVAAPYRRSAAALMLAAACYRWGIERHIAFSFIDCNPHLKPFFERLGFRQVVPDFEHSIYGRVHPLVLDARDAALLSQTTRRRHGQDSGRHRSGRVPSARHRIAAGGARAGGVLEDDQLAGH
jgi:hypothetical protein